MKKKNVTAREFFSNYFLWLAILSPFILILGVDFMDNPAKDWPKCLAFVGGVCLALAIFILVIMDHGPVPVKDENTKVTFVHSDAFEASVHNCSIGEGAKIAAIKDLRDSVGAEPSTLPQAQFEADMHNTTLANGTIIAEIKNINEALGKKK